jgi:hypothetical protein
MPKPVPIPSGPLAVTDADIARAEQFVAALAQVFQSGTSGGSLVTEAMLFPNVSAGADPATIPPVPYVADTKEKQLFFRQLAHALARSLVGPASATQLGVVELSSPPSDPTTPVAVNRDEVSVTPGANLIPRANSNGLIDPTWIAPGPGPIIQPDSVFAAHCSSAEAVGNLVYVRGSNKVVRNIDPTNVSKMLAVGCVISKSDSSHCDVQTSDLVAGVYSGLTPGRMYWAGLNSQPVLTKPAPPVGGLVLQQPIGFAIDVNILLMQPGTNIFKIPG